MSDGLKFLAEHATRLQTGLALTQARAELDAPGAGHLAIGDALASEAEALALDLMRSARVALGAGARITDSRARHAELSSAVKLAHAASAVSQALDRRQGKGITQRVVVERVEVQGGQAIIGAVAPGGGSRADRRDG